MWDREDYLPERASLNNQNGDALCQYFVSPIRNAANAKMQIRNVETGEIYKQRELGSMGAGFLLQCSQRLAAGVPACQSHLVRHRCPGPALARKGPWQRFR